MNSTEINGEWFPFPETEPNYCELVIIAYSDKDGSNKGVDLASFQPSGLWLPCDYRLSGEYFDESTSIVSHWTPFQEWLKHPIKD